MLSQHVSIPVPLPLLKGSLEFRRRELDLYIFPLFVFDPFEHIWVHVILLNTENLWAAYRLLRKTWGRERRKGRIANAGVEGVGK